MDSFREDSQQFFDWLRSQDRVRISSKIELADLRRFGAGRGVVATEDIDADEELFYIPHSAVISVQSSDLRTKAPEIKAVAPWPAVIITMIYEHRKFEEGKWWPYFKVLPPPESLNTLLYWTDLELEELKGSAVLQKLDYNAIEKLIDTEVYPFVAKHWKIFGDWASSSQTAMTMLPRYVKWMGSLVMAYAFDIENLDEEDGPAEDDELMEVGESKAMVPMADMLNADGEEKNNARLEEEEGGLQMVAIKPIPKGGECFNDYGPVPKSDLLRRYGYTTDEYSDVAEVSLAIILKVVAGECGISESDLSDRSTEDYRGLLKPFTKALQRTTDCEECELFDESGYDIPSAYTSGFFDPGMLLTVEALSANETELESLKALKQAPLRPTSQKQKNILSAIIQDRLKEYSTTIAEDKELLKNQSLSYRYRQALEVRLGEKQVLAQASDSLWDKYQLETNEVNTQETKRQKIS